MELVVEISLLVFVYVRVCVRNLDIYKGLVTKLIWQNS
jgi:hypothetical protein